jgi:hypothetical protein
LAPVRVAYADFGTSRGRGACYAEIVIAHARRAQDASGVPT